MNNVEALQFKTKDKDGGGDGGNLIIHAEIKVAANGYVLEVMFYDGEELVEVHTDIEDVFESIRNLGI